MADVIYLLRHAAPPEANRRRYWGVKDPGTDPAGLAEAAALVPLIRERPFRLISSPVERCVRTAGAVAEMAGVPAYYDQDLAEIDFGLLDGLDFAEISRDFPDEADAWANRGDAYAFPGGEAIQAFFQRSVAVWKRWRDAREQALLVVSHAGIISAWMCLFLGLPLSKRFTFSPAYSALTAFRRSDDGFGWNLAFFNNRV